MSSPPDFELKRNDTSTRTFTLKNPDGTRFDLTGYGPGNLAFFFQIATLDDAGAKVTGAGTFTIIDAPNGVVSYQFAAVDTAAAGLTVADQPWIHRGEIESLLGAIRNTFPQDDYFTFEITADLGDQ